MDNTDSSSAAEGFALLLEKIEGFYFSTAVYEAMRNGLLEAFKGGESIAKVATAASMDEGALSALVDFLATQGILSVENSRATLAPLGECVTAASGWFDLLIGGYSPTMAGLPLILRSGKARSTRDEALIRRGSGEMDKYDVIPAFRRLIYRQNLCPEVITDLGCGSGACLVALCREFSAHGIGVARGEDAVREAQEHVERAGYGGRIRIVDCDVVEFSQAPAPDIFVCAFVLQEIAYQRGVDGVGEFLKGLRADHPRAWFLLAEVPERGAGAALGPYYRCYRFVHHLTRQLILPEELWIDLFNRAGYQLVDREPVDADWDPFGVELCLAFRASA